MKNLNVKKVVLWTVGCVGIAVLAMAAYYGIWTFQEQNDFNILNPMGFSIVAIACSCIAMVEDKKKKNRD